MHTHVWMCTTAQEQHLKVRGSECEGNFVGGKPRQYNLVHFDVALYDSRLERARRIFDELAASDLASEEKSVRYLAVVEHVQSPGHSQVNMSAIADVQDCVVALFKPLDKGASHETTTPEHKHILASLRLGLTHPGKLRHTLRDHQS